MVPLPWPQVCGGLSWVVGTEERPGGLQGRREREHPQDSMAPRDCASAGAEGRQAGGHGGQRKRWPRGGRGCDCAGRAGTGGALRTEALEPCLVGTGQRAGLGRAADVAMVGSLPHSDYLLSPDYLGVRGDQISAAQKEQRSGFGERRHRGCSPAKGSHRSRIALSPGSL